MPAEAPIKPEEPAEIYDYPDHVLIVIDTHQTEELPRVQLSKNLVIVSYPRKFVFKGESHVEIHSMQIERRIELPRDYNYELADMEFNNGVLTIKLKKIR